MDEAYIVELKRELAELRRQPQLSDDERVRVLDLQEQVTAETVRKRLAERAAKRAN